jgi:hypothetical protein
MLTFYILFFYGAMTLFGPGHLIIGVSSWHTGRHARPVELLWTNNRPVADADTYTIHNKQKRRACMFSAWFEPATPPLKRPQTYTLDGRATGIGTVLYTANHFQRKIGYLNFIKKFKWVSFSILFCTTFKTCCRHFWHLCFCLYNKITLQLNTFFFQHCTIFA